LRGVLRHSAFAGALLLLAGCGGGGGLGGILGGNGNGTDVSDIPWPVDAVAVQSLTGGKPPTHTGADVGRSVDRLAAAANSLLVGDLLVFVTNGPPTRGETSCSGDRCTSGFLGSALNLLLEDELGIRGPSAYQAVAEHRGVLLAQGRGKGEVGGTAAHYTGYGGWLDHSFFAVEFNRIADGILENTPFNYGYSIGDAPETNPVAAGGSGTWSGVMVGADVSATAARGDRIQGEATLTIADFAAPAVDVAFRAIYNLDDRSPLPDMTWTGIAVTAGAFAATSIEGRFYGPDHEEVGGVFERNEILGAFGAARE